MDCRFLSTRLLAVSSRLMPGLGQLDLEKRDVAVGARPVVPLVGKNVYVMSGVRTMGTWCER